MRFETSTQMKLGQQMKLTPRMIQSMEVLQMPMAELEERISQELESNIALELSEDSPDDRSVEADRTDADRDAAENERELTVSESGDSDFERLDAFESANPDAAQNEYSAAGLDRPYEPPRTRAADGERDAKLDAMSNTPARSQPLVDQLQDQWSLVDVDESLRPIGSLIISFLEDDGYLRTPLETIIDRAPSSMGTPTVEQAERALSAVQLFLEPAGVAARDIRECILLQLDALDDESSRQLASRAGLDPERQNAISGLCRRIVESHLDDLSQNRLPKVAEDTGASLDDIKEAMAYLRRLSVAPARSLAPDESAVIRPDAIVEYDEEADRYIAYLTDTRLSSLRLNREYATMVKDRHVPKTDRDFIRTNLDSARSFIDAISQRRHTLMRVINVVVEAQRDFFDLGPHALKPLPMTQVADQLGIHVATVSRAVSEKYLQTPRGVVPLRSFFTGGTQTESGEDVSWEAIRAALQEVIDGEDKKKPYSDEALVKQLKERGIDIARRTVAKYRAQLDIPSARLRKQY